MYDDTALERLQQILLFKELQFTLKEIKAILDSPILTEAGFWNSRFSCWNSEKNTCRI